MLFRSRNILKDHADDIEKFGMVMGKYVKLSDRLIQAIQTDSKEHIRGLSGINQDFVKQISESRCLYYSKRIHGDFMLRNILPQIVEGKCIHFFRRVYFELKNME